MLRGAIKFALFGMVAGIFPLVLSAQEGAFPGPNPAVIEKKNLSRVDDFVVVRGEKLKRNLNNEIGKLSLDQDPLVLRR